MAMARRQPAATCCTQHSSAPRAKKKSAKAMANKLKIPKKEARNEIIIFGLRKLRNFSGKNRDGYDATSEML